MAISEFKAPSTRKSEVLEQGRYPIVRWWEQTGDVLHRALLRLHRALGEVQPGSPNAFLMLATVQAHRQLIDLAWHYGGSQGPGCLHATVQAAPMRCREGRLELSVLERLGAMRVIRILFLRIECSIRGHTAEPGSGAGLPRDQGKPRCTRITLRSAPPSWAR